MSCVLLPARRAAAWKKVLSSLLCLVVVVGLAVAALGRWQTARWNAYADSLRARGQPVTFLEIEPYRAVVPEERNGARVIERLAGELEAVKEGRADRRVWVFGGGKDASPDFFQGLARYRIEPSRDYVEQHRGLLEALDALRDMPTGRYHIAYDPSNPIGTHLPSLAFVRTAAKLEYLASVLRLVDGDARGALEDIGVQFRIAATFHDEPILISRLVQMAIENLAVTSVEELMRVTQVDELSLKSLDGLIDERIANDTMKWALLGERAYFIDLCEAMARGRIPMSAFTATGPDGQPMGPSLPRLPTMLLRTNQLRGAQMETRLVEAAGDAQALLKTARQLEAEVATLPITQVLARAMIPSLSRAVMLHVKIKARLLCARAALAAERFRLEHGRLPGGLAELVPAHLDAVPIDPFDGQPMRFRITDDGIAVYSIAEDLADDGGDLVETRDSKGKAVRPRDVGFRLNRPDRRGLVILDVPPASDD